MRAVELVLILLAVVAALHLLAERFGIPRPALLMLGGLLLAVTPGRSGPSFRRPTRWL
jgi:Kef-type K+ transport system membrane component KefB